MEPAFLFSLESSVLKSGTCGGTWLTKHVASTFHDGKLSRRQWLRKTEPTSKLSRVFQDCLSVSKSNPRVGLECQVGDYRRARGQKKNK